MIRISKKIKVKVFIRDNYSCQKCHYYNKKKQGLEIHHIVPKSNSGDNHLFNLIVLCEICHTFAPSKKEEFSKFIKEKIDFKILETFRKYKSKDTKSYMLNTFKKEKVCNRPPFGYTIINHRLIISKDSDKVKRIFNEFLKNKISLRKLAKNNGFSVNGIQKLISNEIYLGIIKFQNNKIYRKDLGIIDKNLFVNVQNKLREVTRVPLLTLR